MERAKHRGRVKAGAGTTQTREIGDRRRVFVVVSGGGGNGLARERIRSLVRYGVGDGEMPPLRRHTAHTASTAAAVAEPVIKGMAGKRG